MKLVTRVLVRLFGRYPYGPGRKVKSQRAADRLRVASLSEKQEAQIVVNYSRAPLSLLDSLCDLHGSDKGGTSGHENPFPWRRHTYSDFVALLFEPFRENVKLVFECGIGSTDPAFPANMGPRGTPGASLRVWRDYFPNAEIVGADIDEAVLFTEQRISTYSVDQSNQESVAQMWQKIGKFGFQLMIDDGLHTFEAGKALFLGSFNRLAKNGTYIIEDVRHDDMIRYMDFFAPSNLRVQFVSLFRPPGDSGYTGLNDNQLVLVRHP